MASNAAVNSANSEVELPPDGAIRVIVADSEPIFRVGVRKIVAVEDDIRIVAQVETEAAVFSAVGRFNADIMLYEGSLSDNAFDAISRILSITPELKIVLVTANVTEEETVEMMRRGAWGIITRSIAPDLLIRCIRKVHEGETWLDKRGVNWVIDAYRAQAAQLTSPRQKVKLSPKELQIISGVTQGLRNKDIAQEVGTTEQVVKNYLRKVYDKLGVSDRLELALYCMHHKLLEHAVPQDNPGQPLTPNEAATKN
ncbi:MAG: response regulator transcription factor [Acidobacteriota bacterium]|nr:response regulator transcription factor [Acidobacteriota bacterium]